MKLYVLSCRTFYLFLIDVQATLPEIPGEYNTNAPDLNERFFSSCSCYVFHSSQRSGPVHGLHDAEYPVHAHRQPGDRNRCRPDGEQAERKCLH